MIKSQLELIFATYNEDSEVQSEDYNNQLDKLDEYQLAEWKNYLRYRLSFDADRAWLVSTGKVSFVDAATGNYTNTEDLAYGVIKLLAICFVGFGKLIVLMIIFG